MKGDSFKLMRQYAYNEGSYMILGIVFLVLASFSYLATPWFIGEVIDLLQKGDFDGVADLCVYMLIIIFVSLPPLLPSLSCLLFPAFCVLIQI